MKHLNGIRHSLWQGTMAAWCSLFVVLGARISVGAQDTKPQVDSQRQLSPIQIQNLLRKPNGLEAAASIVGHFVINGEPEVYVRPDLAGLVQVSSLIAQGKIVSRESKLEENGNIIVTSYVLRPTQVLKGRTPGDISDITFHTLGGLVKFSNGTSAEWRTISWGRLQVGREYVTLLKSDTRAGYMPTNGIEALFEISGPNQIVDSFAAHHDEHHQVTNEVEGLKAPAFLDKLRAKISAK